MSIYAIGDIHGHLTALDRLLIRIPFEESDTLIFLGDYVDRGPNARAVIERGASRRPSDLRVDGQDRGFVLHTLELAFSALASAASSG